MSSLPLILPAFCLVFALVFFIWGWLSRGRLLKEALGLRAELNRLQSELHKEEGKAGRFLGYITRLQNFGVSASGRIPDPRICRDSD